MRPLCLLAVALCLALPATAGELAGVHLDDTLQVGDDTLVLNGMGLRKKAFIKVYVAGLYLPGKSGDAGAILAADAPRHLTMHFLYRSVDADALCEGWTDGLAANSPSAGAEVEAAFETLCGYMEEVGKGDRIQFTYVPGKGTSVRVKGTEKGTLAGREFADALFRCWLGPEPPSEDFKSGLLGR